MSTKERRSRQQYSPEFKLKLVKMALAASENGSSVATLAREYGINDNLLFKWIRLWQNARSGIPATTSRPEKCLSRAFTRTDNPTTASLTVGYHSTDITHSEVSCMTLNGPERKSIRYTHIVLR
ncbi:transposase [Yersinia proxima]|uniref:transposase n=1 Tax=Yersinia proxima TaxID=2890316 RepID=UPI001D111BC9|nr:transposase [Yersinia proxima]